MKVLLKRDAFTFTINKAFRQVIRACKEKERADQDGTWITDDVEAAYIQLHKLGYAHSVEAWRGTELVGGLYGIKIGKIFFGESMFSVVSNASKFAFIKFVQQLQEEGIQLIDCQQQTQHLISLGAEMMERRTFIQMLDKYC